MGFEFILWGFESFMCFSHFQIFRFESLCRGFESNFILFHLFFKRKQIHFARIRIHGLWLLFFFTWDSNLSYEDSNPCCPSKLIGIEIWIHSIRIRISFFRFLNLHFFELRFKSSFDGFKSTYAFLLVLLLFINA